MTPEMFVRAVSRMRAAQKVRDEHATVGNKAKAEAHEAVVDDYLSDADHEPAPSSGGAPPETPATK